MPLNPLNIPLGVFSLEAAEQIADAIDDAGAPPAGIKGDVQFNKGDGTFGSASDVAAGCTVNLDTNIGNGLLVNIAAGGAVFTSDSDFDVTAAAMEFEATSGNVQFTADNGEVNFQASSGSMSFESPQITLNGTLSTILNLQVFANNAAAISGGLVGGNIYRTSTGQLMVVF